MNDWKPGDRFTIEYEVQYFDGGIVGTKEGTIHLPAVMARAVKLPPKARLVRKGDEIVSENGAVGRLLAYYPDHHKPCIWISPGGAVIASRSRGWTHADGAEIDWEASE